ncbi:outer membrane beta-barrel protein [Salinibacter ruber]|jgi:opacity protein-like surface antigen|uniref:outer membrane beta-barrel protein n=1 Tax=Salinibacter ruber TaxID=146919 RepID=UPI000E6C85A4|nr:outer membrane beta-barrel protein [Salinibacter ruber]
MRFRASAVVFLLVVASLWGGGGRAEAQSVRVEAGGGWAIPSTTLIVDDTDGEPAARVDPGSGPSGYVAVGLVWTLTDDLSLEGRVRAQQSQLRVGSDDISPGDCVGACPEGRLRALSLEGQLTLTSVGRIAPYFLVGLGVVRTTVDAARIKEGNTPQLSETDVTDAGGDVGLGAALRLVEGLSLMAEARVTGSLPGGKENAVTTFPFTLGFAYHFQ